MKLLAIIAFATLSLSACHMLPKSITDTQTLTHPMPKTHAVQSSYNFDDTVDRLTSAITDKGMTIFSVIDHQKAANDVGTTMQPAKVIIFGTPKAGTPLMKKDPNFALQLPLKVLVTETDGKVMVVYHNTQALIEGSRLDYADVKDSLARAETLLQNSVK